MRTLSIRQPWAWLITRPDLSDAAERAAALAADRMKTVENRGQPTVYRGLFLIHAGASVVKRDYREQADLLEGECGIVLPDVDDLAAVPRGGIVGAAELVNVVTSHPSRFFIPGNYGYVLANARSLTFLPWKGQLNWFDVPRSAINWEAPCPAHA